MSSCRHHKKYKYYPPEAEPTWLEEHWEWFKLGLGCIAGLVIIALWVVACSWLSIWLSL